MKAPEGFVRQGYEMSLYEGQTVISPLEVSEKGSYKENAKEGIVITVSSDTAHQINPDTGAVIVEVEQPNDEQVGSLTLTKTGEQPVEVKGDSLLAKAKRLAGKTVAVSGSGNVAIYATNAHEPEVSLHIYGLPDRTTAEITGYTKLTPESCNWYRYPGLTQIKPLFALPVMAGLNRLLRSVLPDWIN